MHNFVKAYSNLIKYSRIEKQTVLYFIHPLVEKFLTMRWLKRVLRLLLSTQASYTRV